MDTNRLISIIVPIFNTREELSRCVESIIGQTYSNIEIILVDDGSTDGSEEICDTYAKKDRRIRVIHKDNGGNTSARKAGLEIAKGQYIGFVDSDDWIEATMFEELEACIDKCNADIVCSGYYVDNNSVSEMLDGVGAGKYEKESNFEHLLENLIYIRGSEKKGISSSLWNKLFRKETIYQVMMSLNDEIQVFEDAACVYLSILKSSIVYILDKSFYHYCTRYTSILHSKDANYFIKINLLYNRLRKEFESDCYYKELLLEQLGKFMVDILAKGINYYFDFGMEISIPYYLCATEKIPMHSKLILYGAGKLGKSYYGQLRKNKSFDVVAWVDKNYELFQSQGLNVQCVESIKMMEYDYILLGVQFAGTAHSIRRELIDLGILDERIIWEEPRCIAEVKNF